MYKVTVPTTEGSMAETFATMITKERERLHKELESIHMSVVTVFDGLVSRLFDGLPVCTSRALWRAREAELGTRS